MAERLELVAAGDFALSHHLHVGASESDGVRDHFRSADLAMVNLELSLTVWEAAVDKAITLRAGPSIARSIRVVGAGLATVANDHALDHGPGRRPGAARGSKIRRFETDEELAPWLRIVPAWFNTCGVPKLVLVLDRSAEHSAQSGADVKTKGRKASVSLR